MYLSFALFCEGPSDYAYLEIIIPRVVNSIILQEGARNVDVAEQPTLRLGRSGREVASVARELCSARDAVHLVFVHADTGGRAQEAGLEARSIAYCRSMNDECNWPCDRCIIVAPRHETEAWTMLDHNAIADALGYRGDLYDRGLPRTAREIEGLNDPKITLGTIISNVRGRRRSDQAVDLYPAIGGRQNIETLRTAPSFNAFENQLRIALRGLGCIN